MANPYRDLFKHSAVYGLGQVLSRLASFLLLPVYTSYLRPADYGIIAILDFIGGMLAILIGAGMASAVTRYHFEANDDRKRACIWWTGLTCVAVTGVVCILPALSARDLLAVWTLGPTVTAGGFYYALILPTMWFNVIGQLLDGYLRVRKWSGLSVGVNLFRLIFNIGLNVYCLAVLGLGVTGILLGNLITSGLVTLLLFGLFARHVGTYSFHYSLLTQLWQFGGPLIGTALLSSLMHEADRYLLRLFVDMEQVGIYSLAYMVSYGVYSLCLLPFTMIWSVLVYEIAERPDAKEIYIRVFEYFTYGLALIMLGVSLFAGNLLGVMVAPDYLQATDLIPIICLAYLFFGLHEHFRVPVMLAKKTLTLLPVVSIATLVNLGANLGLIPLLGTAGAAWASVLTFAVYSLVGLWRYRRIDRFPYPFTRCASVVGGMIITYLVYDQLIQWRGQAPSVWAFAIGSWLLWGIVLVGPVARKLWTDEGWASLRMWLSVKSVH
ncbi:MAG: hypothetical protein D6704_02175 [Nitrospirae bacterium]|nr:MAG: hypothetical protein D6704_02175 [Nitrospirota bacterium]